LSKPITLAKAHKYHATATIVDGIRFPSKKQARRYSELRFLEKSKLISRLALEPRYAIVVNEQHICDYVADFKYVDITGEVIEDVKGVKTPVYRLKKKLVEAIYGITVKET